VIDEIGQWTRRRSHRWDDWTLDELVAAKQDGGHRVSVVIPARDEESTVGGIVETVRRDLVDAVGLVDEVIVIDSDSRDATADCASAAGATVYAACDIHPELGSWSGKGEAMWKAQFVATGDIFAFLDADLTVWGSHFVRGIVAPLLIDSGVQLVKGFYERPMHDSSSALTGGRVTELVARPLLALQWPALAGVRQPLSGEWAVRREHFAGLAVPVGYGVEFAAVVDTFEGVGLDSIAQVDLGTRVHDHQSLLDLGMMAAELLAVAERRVGRLGRSSVGLRQFPGGEAVVTRDVPLFERPPGRVVLAGVAG
jgi:glucosyl-3-phosphoglycerate synthase